jgi:hypothetical protein
MEILNHVVRPFRGLRRPLSIATRKRRFRGSVARTESRGDRSLTHTSAMLDQVQRDPI